MVSGGYVEYLLYSTALSRPVCTPGVHSDNGRELRAEESGEAGDQGSLQKRSIKSGVSTR